MTKHSRVLGRKCQVDSRNAHAWSMMYLHCQRKALVVIFHSNDKRGGVKTTFNKRKKILEMEKGKKGCFTPTYTEAY
jgi:hypothetical protein